MQVLLTGGTGFVGGAVAHALAAAGHRVRALVRSRTRAHSLEPLGAELVLGDLADERSLAEAAAGAEAVVHAAGIWRERLPGDFTRVNVEGTRRVLEAARGAGSVSRFVFVSSISAVGPAERGEVLDEESPCRPGSAYGRGMLNAERLVRAFGETIPFTILRAPLVYGTGDRRLLPLYKLAQHGIAPTVADDDQRVSLLAVDDLAGAVVQALESPAAARGTFFVADADTPATRDVVQEIGLAAGTQALVIRVPPLAAFGAAMIAEGLGRLAGVPVPLDTDVLGDILGASWACSAERARAAFGFDAKLPWREGLRQAATWYLTQPLLP